MTTLDGNATPALLSTQPSPRPGVSTLRLWLLRAMYLLVAVGLGLQIWPLILHHPPVVEHMRSVVRALLGAVALLALIGIRHPLKMLPLLLFELVWKLIWVLAFGVPLYRANAFSPATLETWYTCLGSVVVLAAVVPWPYVWRTYIVES